VSGSEQQRERTSHAEPDDPNLASASFLLRKEGARSFNIGEEFPLAGRSISDDRNDASNLAPRMEQIGSDRQISLARKPISMVPQVLAHARRIVQHDHTCPRFAFVGLGKPRRKIPRRSADIHISHCWSAALRGRGTIVRFGGVGRVSQQRRFFLQMLFQQF